VFGIGRLCPHQIPEQAAQLGHGGRQQVQPQSKGVVQNWGSGGNCDWWE
jgi:hypothetical protein